MTGEQVQSGTVGLSSYSSIFVCNSAGISSVSGRNMNQPESQPTSAATTVMPFDSSKRSGE